MKTIVTSARFTINPAQWDSIKKSLYKYTLPLLLVFLLEIQQGKELKQALVVVYCAGLQLVINFLSKFLTESSYTK